jgi:anti-sigma factor RsiW
VSPSCDGCEPVTSEPTELHALTGAYVLDAIDDDEREVFGAHLDTCEPCAREVQELQATAAQLGAAAHETPTSGAARTDPTRGRSDLAGVTRPRGFPGHRPRIAVRLRGGRTASLLPRQLCSSSPLPVSVTW